MKFSFLINILIAVLVTLISESFYRNFLSNVTSMVHVGSFASRSQVSLPADELCILVTVEIMELNIITLGELNLFWETWLSSFITGYHSNKHLELELCTEYRLWRRTFFLLYKLRKFSYQPGFFSVRFIYNVDFSFSEKTGVISEWGQGIAWSRNLIMM